MAGSGTNLLGMVKHLAAVEYGWFCLTFGRETEPLPFDGGGQVLVSATTAGMANPTEFTFGPPISLELKGLAGPHVVHELR